jgi:sugar phosphate isomerase/epimerase
VTRDPPSPFGPGQIPWVNHLSDLREIGWDGMEWIDLAQNKDQWKALVNTVMNLRVP